MDVIEVNLADACWRFDGARTVWLFFGLVQQIADALERRESTLRLAVRLHELGDRVDQAPQVALKGHQCADRRLASQHQVTTKAEDGDLRERHHQIPNQCHASLGVGG